MSGSPGKLGYRKAGRVTQGARQCQEAQRMKRKGTCHRGEHAFNREAGGQERTERAWGQEQEFPNHVHQEHCPHDVPRSPVSLRISLASSVTRS